MSNQMSEKDLLIKGKELEDLPKRSNKLALFRKLMKWVSFVLIAGWGYSIVCKNWGGYNVMFSFDSPTIEVFEVAPSHAVPSGSEVASYLLFNQSVLQDGITADYYGTTFDCNGGFLTLNITNQDTSNAGSGIVTEISIGDFPVWRTSTPFSTENTITRTSASKNVSQYLNLFESNQTVSVAILEGVPSNSISFSLSLTLYKDLSVKMESDIFTSNGAASSIYPLGRVKLPQERFSIEVGQLPANSTVAKLQLFASATDDEVTYYRNKLSSYFEPSSGPLRYLNVFANNIFIASIIPQPTLFHPHRISDKEDTCKLWSLLANTGSFSGLAYEIDLIPILPLLWGSSVTLDVVISSPVSVSAPQIAGTVTPNTGAISSNSWIVSGNLLVWQSDLILGGKGKLLSSSSYQNGFGVVIEPPVNSPYEPVITNQIVESFTNSNISTLYNFTLVDNTTAAYLVNFTSLANSSSNQFSRKSKYLTGPPGTGSYIESQTNCLNLLGFNGFNFTVSDLGTNRTVLSKSFNNSHPLKLSEESKELNNSPWGPANSYGLKAALISSQNATVNGTPYESKTSDEKAVFDTQKGFDTEISVKVEAIGEKPFFKEVEAINGVITKNN